jgi:molybdenum cofactor biosynthesis enzyme MoaA
MVVALADVIAPHNHKFCVVARRRDLGQRGTLKACLLSEVTYEKRRSIPRDCLLRRDVKWSVALTWLILALVR